MRAYSIKNRNSPYFLTWTVVDWIDIFTRQRYRDIVLESIKYCVANKGLILHAYVIMSNHMHLIVSAKPCFSLSDIIWDCKKYTSKEIIKSLNQEPESRKKWIIDLLRSHGIINPNNQFYQLWQQSNHAIELSDLRRCYQRLAYVHMNPVTAGIVTEPEHYLYSSARNYARLSNILDVTLLEIIPLDGYLRPLGWNEGTVEE